MKGGGHFPAAFHSQLAPGRQRSGFELGAAGIAHVHGLGEDLVGLSTDDDHRVMVIDSVQLERGVDGMRGRLAAGHLGVGVDPDDESLLQVLGVLGIGVHPQSVPHASTGPPRGYPQAGAVFPARSQPDSVAIECEPDYSI